MPLEILSKMYVAWKVRRKGMPLFSNRSLYFVPVIDQILCESAKVLMSAFYKCSEIYDVCAHSREGRHCPLPSTVHLNVKTLT